jgi:hypothetical protein
VRKALEDADLQTSGIDEIILVGGSTRIPKIQDLVKKYFNDKVSGRIHIIQDGSIENALGTRIKVGIVIIGPGPQGPVVQKKFCH